jgi:hypothetical protein
LDVGLCYGLEQVARLEEALALLDAATIEPQPLADDDPVFVAGLGWRTGSTLVQRALMTDPNILVWGEPMDRLLLLDRLTEPLLSVTREWPADSHWISHRPGVDRVRDWVAMLSPDAGHLRAAYRAFLDAWLAAPARTQGFARWGAKEVRWSGVHAVMLRWLYPHCSFALIVRHPVSAYLSLRRAGFEPPEWGHLVRWPDRWIITLDDYAQFWNALALTWGAVADKLGAHWLRYEDLVEGRADLNAIGAAIGLSLTAETALASRAGAGLREVALSAEEVARINELTSEGRALFAYAQ